MVNAFRCQAWGHYAACVTPNLHKLLVRWGMEEELKKYGTKANRLHMVDCTWYLMMALLGLE